MGAKLIWTKYLNEITLDFAYKNIYDKNERY
jgi:hypothetical protein